MSERCGFGPRRSSNSALSYFSIQNLEAEHLALADLDEDVFSGSNVGLTEQHSVDSRQEEEDDIDMVLVLFGGDNV